MSQKCPTLYKYEYLELLTYLNVVFLNLRALYISICSPLGPSSTEYSTLAPCLQMNDFGVIRGVVDFFCCGAGEEPLLSVYGCLRKASVVMSPSWKYTNCLCVLVPCSLVPAGSTEHSVPSGRQSLSVCTGFAESLSTLTVHMHIITHTHGSVTDRQEHSLSNTEPLWSRSIFFSLKKLVVLAFAQCATKYIYILLHSLPSLGFGKRCNKQKQGFFLVEVITPVPASNHHTDLKYNSFILLTLH